MISFPNGTMTSGASNTLYREDGTVYNKSTSVPMGFDVDKIKAYNFTLNSKVKQELLRDESLDMTKNGSRPEWRTLRDVSPIASSKTSIYENDKSEKITQARYENPFHLPAALIKTVNRYNRIYTTPVNNLLNIGAIEDKQSLNNDTSYSVEIVGAKTKVVSSIFNTTHMIQVNGITDNIPIMNLGKDNEISEDIMLGDYSSIGSGKDDDLAKVLGVQKVGDSAYININYNPFNAKLITNTSNCTMRELVALSHQPNSVLGQARYKYADFIFCKDLGKVSNNHMITLRRFAHPVGDNIFRFTGKAYRNTVEYGQNDFQENASIACMVTWFGTDDNKLDDILKYSFKSTWKELKAEIQERDSKEDDPDNGLIGLLANSFSPTYNKQVARGMAGTNSIWNKLGSRVFGGAVNSVGRIVGQGSAESNGVNSHGMSQWDKMYMRADQNKVYTPKNTIQSTHIYEGRLEFSHEFTLNFSYKLRAYDVMNPKTVMLDLIGNILEMTYNRGHFWGGEKRIIGPPRNNSSIAKTNAFIDRQWNKLEGFALGFANGTLDWKGILGSLSDAANSALSSAKTAAEETISSKGANLVSIAQKMVNNFVKAGASGALLGQLKNALGRPAVYCFDSLLDGAPVGLWHVTIGNPKNPIAAFGNLILENTQITHTGPLGFDDFPSEIKVTCTLKHGRPRDLTEISRMYTKGVSAFYNTLDKNKLSEFFSVSNTKSGQEIETKLDSIHTYNKYREQIDQYTSIVDDSQDELNRLKKEKAAKEKEQKEKNNDTEQRENKLTANENETNDSSNLKSSPDKKDESNSESNEKSVSAEYDKKIAETEQRLKEAQNRLKNAKQTIDSLGLEYTDFDKTFNTVQSLSLFTPDDETTMPEEKWKKAHYINDQWALRYETLGQDRDIEGRLVIDENV